MNNKLITIVGMGPGISFETAKKFAANGFTVAMIARREASLNKLRDQLKGLGYKNIHPYAADVSNFEDLKKAFVQIRLQLGHTHVLHYNVSVYREAMPTKLEPEVLCKDFRANVAAAVTAVQQVIDHMKDKQNGKIFITGGGLALDPYPEYTSLAIGKAGIRNFGQSLAKELKPKGIHVAMVTVCGMVKPDTPYAPVIVADHFWNLYLQQEPEWEHEIVIK